MAPAPPAGWGNPARVRETATTGAPASAKAVAIPRPKPRLAPTTTVVLSDKSLTIVLFLCLSMVSRCWDRDDHDVSGVGGVDNRNGRRADLGRQRGQALR